MRGTGRRGIALLLVAVMLCSMLPAFVLAQDDASDYLCGHEHDDSCGYSTGDNGTPCLHIHDEACGYVEGLPCTDIHTHDDSCGYVEGSPCTYTHTHDDACGYCAGGDCTYTHTHDEACGYCAGSDCTYTHTHDEACGYCAGSDCTYTHTHDEACGYCAGSDCTYTHTHDDACGYSAGGDCTYSHTHDSSCGYDAETGGGCTDSHTHDDSCGYAKASPCTDSHTHDDSCGYAKASPCTDTHTHDDSCGYAEASPCTDTHTHDDSCGYVKATPCTDTHIHDDSCGYAEAAPCTDVHTHDDSCGYVEAAPCGYIHTHNDSCGYVEAVACGHIHDDSCGYTPPDAGSPCRHVCEILSFTGHIPGEAVEVYEAAAGDTYDDILSALPETLSGSLACAEGDTHIPVRWTCVGFAGEAGEYIFRAELVNEHCAYAAVDLPETELVDEGELPFITVTLPPSEPALPPVLAPVCICGELCSSETVNAECPLCAADPAACAAGQPPVLAPVCICGELCSAETVNAECPLCALDPAACAAGQPLLPPLPLPLLELEDITLEATTADGALVSVAGLLPAAAGLSVDLVPIEEVAGFVDDDRQIVFAYDIKILLPGEPEPTEYQPTAENPVTVTITPEAPIQGPTVEVVHLAEDEDTGTTIPQTVQNVTTTETSVEFEAEGFSVYVVTTGTYTPRVTFSYDDASLVVKYSTDNSTYTLLGDNVSVAAGTMLYFKVTSGEVAGVFRDGNTTEMTADNNGVYTVAITENTIITIGAAVTLDVTYGKIVIGENNGSGRVYTHYNEAGTKQTGDHSASNIYTITGSAGSADNGGAYNVALTGEGDFNVVLSEVTIYTGENGDINVGKGLCAPVSTSRVTGSGNINITLVGKNILENVSANPSDSYAALEKAFSDSTLIINGPGELDATGGADSAGIGSSDMIAEGTKNITINGGTIVAVTKGSQGAGIGSGNNKSAENIRIYGGNITATGLVNGAGIGGSGSVSFTATSGQVFIYGGSITAISKGTGAGIGGGGSGTGVESTGGAGEVYIFGGDITASSIGGGAGGIGGGAATVNITGGKVTTTGSIGGGNSTNASGGLATIAISGGTITAANISGGHGVGGSHAGGTLSVTGGSAKVDHVCGEINTTGLGDAVLSYTVIVKDGETAVENMPVTGIVFSPSLSDYGLNDVQTDGEGKLYLWLPSGTAVTSVTAGGETYSTGGGIEQKTASISPTNEIDVGETLTATLTGDTAGSWQWQRYTAGKWANIEGATSSSYTVQSSDAGHQLLVIINGVHSLPVFVSVPPFTVTIPESVDMTTTHFSITGQLTDFKVGQSITVTVRSARGFKLALTGAPDIRLPYALYTDEEHTLPAIANNGNVATFTGNSSDVKRVYYSIDTPPYSGTYTDTLTFTVSFNSGS